MPTMTVRNLPDDVYERVKVFASERGLSAEAFARQVLADATQPSSNLGTDIVDFVSTLDCAELVLERSNEASSFCCFK